MMREKDGVGSFFSSQISRSLLVDKCSILNQYNQEVFNVLGIALILHSRIKTRNEAKASILVVLDTPYMSGMVYASTMPPVVGISYLME